jgi:hypothetical protein
VASPTPAAPPSPAADGDGAKGTRRPDTDIPEGVEGGMAGGVLGEVEVPVVADPSAPAPSEKLVSQQAIEPQRIAGDKLIPLPDDALIRLHEARKDKVTVRTKVCVDEQGAPASVRMQKPSGDDKVDELITTRIMEWRYRPFLVGGVAQRVCFIVLFTYLIAP